MLPMFRTNIGQLIFIELMYLIELRKKSKFRKGFIFIQYQKIIEYSDRANMMAQAHQNTTRGG